MDYYAIYGKEYLAHHGILGQKWGQRNGPPYPLKDENHSKAEKEAEKKFRLTDQQKKYIKIGLAVVGVALATYGVYKLSQTGVLSNFIKSGKNILSKKDFSQVPLKDFNSFEFKDSTGEVDILHQYVEWNEKCKNAFYKDLKDVPKLDIANLYDEEGKLIPDRLLQNLNPDWPNADSRDNCPLTVASAVMRLKGYDVSSAHIEKDDEEWSPVIFTRMFKNAKILYSTKDKFTSKDEIIDTLVKQGEGSYGLFKITRFGTPHGILYYIEDGIAKFYDTQANYIYKKDEVFNFVKYDDAIMCRLDNCDPTDKVLGAITQRDNSETIIPFMTR